MLSRVASSRRLNRAPRTPAPNPSGRLRAEQPRAQTLALAEQAEAILQVRHQFRPARPLSLNPVFLYLFSQAQTRNIAPRSSAGVKLLGEEFPRDVYVETLLPAPDAADGVIGFLLLNKKNFKAKKADQDRLHIVLVVLLFVISFLWVLVIAASLNWSVVLAPILPAHFAWLGQKPHSTHAAVLALFNLGAAIFFWKIFRARFAHTLAFKIAIKNFGPRWTAEEISIEATRKSGLFVVIFIGAFIVMPILSQVFNFIVTFFLNPTYEIYWVPMFWGISGSLWVILILSGFLLNVGVAPQEERALLIQRLQRWRQEEA
jgi:hypothetical protein